MHDVIIIFYDIKESNKQVKREQKQQKQKIQRVQKVRYHRQCNK